MPIYHYVCEACGHDMEALQKISDEPLRDCPDCGRPSLRKQVTAAAFRLKGSGWYETDFKHSGKEQGKEKKDAAGKEAGKADKPAAKQEGKAPAKAADSGKQKSGAKQASGD